LLNKHVNCLIKFLGLIRRYPFNLMTHFHAAAWNIIIILYYIIIIIITLLLLYRRLWSEEEKLEIPLQKKIVIIIYFC
jgi:hypothetical protein